MRRLKPGELLSRITGISTPFVGLSWTPPQKDADFAHRVITFLEDKRALYVPYDDERIVFVTESILQIRERLTEFLDELDSSSELQQPIRAMRDVCRDFLSVTQDIHHRIVSNAIFKHEWDRDTVKYFVELGKLRSTFGLHIAQIAIDYSIEVDEQLAVILPESRRRYGRDF